MAAKRKVQKAMNITRTKMNRGKFRPEDFAVVYEEIETNKISKEFDNYKIVHITDIHLGQWITPEKLLGLVHMINKLNPDLIALTGDYVSYSADNELFYLKTCLKKLMPKDVTVSVLGNHDHWTNPDKIRKTLKESGVINLDNDVYIIKRHNQYLQIAGVDSITVHRDNIKKVLEKLKDNEPAIMLAHEPDFADTTAATDKFILQLSGHSHGGQIQIPQIGTPIRGSNFKKYPLGRYQLKNMVQYTNPGVGTNVFWFRINCPPEITVITLKRKMKT